MTHKPIETVPEKRWQSAAKALEHVKALVQALLTAEFPSVSLLQHPVGTYWGSWEFHDKEYSHLPNSEILITFEPARVMSDAETTDHFRKGINTARACVLIFRA